MEIIRCGAAGLRPGREDTSTCQGRNPVPCPNSIRREAVEQAGATRVVGSRPARPSPTPSQFHAPASVRRSDPKPVQPNRPSAIQWTFRPDGSFTSTSKRTLQPLESSTAF